MQLDRFALYIFDYGAPVGLRVASKHPERVTALISQNGNAYLEGFGNSWGLWQAYWREPTAAHREACRVSLARTDPELAVLRRFRPDERISRRLHARYRLHGPSRPVEIQLDLILDYRTTWHLSGLPGLSPRASAAAAGGVGTQRPPSYRPGARLSHDVPDAEIRFVDAGHFALETHAAGNRRTDARFPRHDHGQDGAMSSSSGDAMLVVLADEPGPPFRIVEIDKPRPERGQVLVRIQASGVNPLDVKIRAGQAPHARHPLPAVLGLDLARTVEVVGPEVVAFKVGDEVYGLAGGVGGPQGTLPRNTRWSTPTC